MEHSIEMTSTDNQIPLLSQTEKNEIEEERKVYHLTDINGQHPSGSQIKKPINQIFQEEFEKLDDSSIESRTIFKVNVWLRESNPDAYTPKVVSIGPYHNKIPQLHPMEKNKLPYLRRFLQRNEELDVESCISKLEKLKEEALKCYDDVETDEFIQMLLLDGCFVVEFIRECCGIRPIGKDRSIKINAYGIIRDLLLLENQLSFFVLCNHHRMTKAILSCPRKPMKKPNHDLKWHMVMPNATDLSEARVRFVTHWKSSLFHIEFENGLMMIPSLRIFDSMETLLRNLIAYEQQTGDVNPTYFSDFAIFIDNLIELDKDVTLLRRKGIIVNFIGEDKQVANLFNKMGTGITTSPNFYYNAEFGKAIEHHKNPRNKIKEKFMQYYFSSLWVGASTLAAVILTAMQTNLAFIK